MMSDFDLDGDRRHILGCIREVALVVLIVMALGLLVHFVVWIFR